MNNYFMISTFLALTKIMIFKIDVHYVNIFPTLFTQTFTLP